MVSLNRTGIIAGATAASLAVVAVAGVGVATSYRNVTIESDGTTKIVSGFFPDVRSALSAADVTLGEADAVQPALPDRISNDQTIEVLRAQPYRVVAGAETVTEWSPAVSLDQVFDQLATEQNEAIVVSRADVRTALPLAESARTVAVKVDDATSQVKVEGGETVATILADASFSPSPLDEVRIELIDGTPGISVVTEQRAFKKATEAIPFTEERVDDPNLETGTEVVSQEGEEGQRTITTYEQVRGGETVVSAVYSDVVSKQPVNKVISVGTKEPAPAPTQAPSTSGGSTAVASSVGGDVWAALAQCESGGNPSTNTGNGFYGMYQFTAGTWQAVGGSGLPSDASAAEQTMRAQILQQRAGWGQWPACSASLGLY